MSAAKLTIGRIGFRCREAGVEAVQRIAIWAQNLVQLAHLQKKVRMILRRGLADTLECLRADANLGHTAIILEFGVEMAIVGRSHHSKRLNCRHGGA